jgi:hypothetical protein
MKNNNTTASTKTVSAKDRSLVQAYVQKNNTQNAETIQKGLKRNGHSVPVGVVRSVLEELTVKPTFLAGVDAESMSELVDKTGIRVVNGRDGMPVIEAHATNQCKTVEQLLEETNYNLDEWDIISSEAGVTHKISDVFGLVPLYKVRAKLAKKLVSKQSLEDLLKAAGESFRSALKVPANKLAQKKRAAKGTMVEFALPDLHLGKLAWNEETGGGNWDLEIAERVWKDAITNLVQRSPEAEEAWIVIGNDFFNVDNNKGETTAGTPQDEDGRWQRTFRKGIELIFWTVGVMRRKFPKVKIIMVYGNHDNQRAFYLGEVLTNRFIGDNTVEVDNNPTDRKFYQWGETGIGFAHGDGIKPKDLPNLCQNEARDIWGRTKHFEMHLGHFHQEMVRNVGGVQIRYCPALCPPDAWHAKSGYTMSEKGALMFVYDQKGLSEQKFYRPDAKFFA